MWISPSRVSRPGRRGSLLTPRWWWDPTPAWTGRPQPQQSPRPAFSWPAEWASGWQPAGGDPSTIIDAAHLAQAAADQSAAQLLEPDWEQWRVQVWGMFSWTVERSMTQFWQAQSRLGTRHVMCQGAQCVDRGGLETISVFYRKKTTTQKLWH